MSYVAGIDLGTSAVKVLLVDKHGNVKGEASSPLDMHVAAGGVREQNPDQWVDATIEALKKIVESVPEAATSIEGMSFSGQMHGLVLLDEKRQVLRPAMLWNDTRTSAECELIRTTLGEELYTYTKNPALEGFTLPKLLWVKAHEPDLFSKATSFVLPKDYLRYRLTGALHMEPSDAAGTLLFHPAKKAWSHEMCHALDIPVSMCPEIVLSTDEVGTLVRDVATQIGVSNDIKVFAGGADNACGALGAGIIAPGETLCSIGTSGVILSYEEQDIDVDGGVHFFNHAKDNVFYTMGVTLAAGYSLQWAKDQLAPNESFEALLDGIETIPPGSRGLLFTPFLNGERTPYSDASIRASWIGMDAEHTRVHLAKAVMEGITFSLNESLQLFRQAGKTINTVVSIGGGAKNPAWLQMQADIFNATVVSLENEQGPSLGAAIIAAAGCGWAPSIDMVVKKFVRRKQEFHPVKENVETYQNIFQLYQQVYKQTAEMCESLAVYRG
ncbi:xylulokinase [Aureibacillus halotolerans]|uniref:Xylulose kinase n=1 Tax=Aureibacillus halotolerans TaxID=1508390 RepID=A0A4V3D605_9BACI|nr:xylulokinase [Aureibacillus halotolerans]TDQ42167.1 xylulokinase [Aureibacillus halotolerans]